ncbi:MAG TPA: phospho-N-acetylmuramoyl-pentapeptide-transferase [Chloroflexota bacterium]|nr:phospho-N-acetylmuramoyl-pentapeptide-transferase [Chloroflexota bacterium]
MTTAAIVALIPLSCLVGLIWAPALIAWLRRLKFGKQIRLEGPSSHQIKAGTPVMGGWLFIVTPVIVTLLLVPDRASLAVPIAAMLLFGSAGALDDYANMKSKEGLGFQVRYKFLWHGVMALALAWWLYQTPDLRTQRLPFGGSFELGWWFIPFAAFVIFSCAAGVNEIDGLDGLAGGTSLAAFGSYLVIGLTANLTSQAAFSAAVAGALLAFLWHNVNPAKVFMGDTGALALGSALAVIALQTRWVFLLPVIGVMFVFEIVTVLMQVGYFKLTHGQRLFKMTPIHHHFELSGWPEPQIVQRFWLIGLIAGSIGLALGVV